MSGKDGKKIKKIMNGGASHAARRRRAWFSKMSYKKLGVSVLGIPKYLLYRYEKYM